MNEDLTAARHQSPAGASEAARAAWEARFKQPRQALALAREALQARPSSAVSGLALATTAVASALLEEPEEALTAAGQVPQLLVESAAGELEDAPAVLVETKLATLRAAFQLNDLALAAQAGQEAIGLAHQHGLFELEARAHSELGAVYGSHQLLDIAMRYMRSAIAILETHDLPVPGALINNLGNIYLDTGRLDEALACFTRAREQFEEDGDRFRASLARCNEGRALVRMARPQEGVAALEEGVALQEGLDNRSYLAATIAKAAEGHAMTGDPRRAEQRFHQAVAVLEEPRPHLDPFADEVRTQYGDFLTSQGRLAEALTQYERGLEAARRLDKSATAVTLLERVSHALAELGRFEEAYRRLREHVSERERLEQTSTDLVLPLQLLELEAQLGHEHELKLVAHQAVIEANRELRERAQHLEGLSITDDLTGLFNRRFFRLRVAEEETRAARFEHDLVLMLIDVDHFKAVNDRFSHTVGDKVLAEVAALLRAAFRETDVVARWGGEEFAVLLPDFSRRTAQAIAERTRRLMQDHDWERFGAGLALTVSIGIAALGEIDASESDGAGERHEALFALADSRLYEAKRQGRNRIVW